MTRKSRVIGVLVAFLGAVGVPGQEVRVNQHRNQIQYPTAVDAAGRGFVVSWIGGANVCKASDDEMIRLADPTGTFMTDDILAQPACNGLTRSGVGLLPSGVVCHVSLDYYLSGREITAKLFDMQGNVLVDMFVVVQGTNRINDPVVAAIPPDRFAVVWEDEGSRNIYGRIVLADGTLPGAVAAIPEAVRYWVDAPQVAASASGGVAVAWVDWDPNGNTGNVSLRLFDRDLVPLTGDLHVASPGPFAMPNRISLGSGPGGSIIAWRRPNDDDVLAAMVDESGNLKQPPFLVPTDTTYDKVKPRAAVDSVGRSIVLWESFGQDGDGSGIYAQRLDQAGNRIGGEFRVNGTTAYSQDTAAVAAGEDGSFVVAWSSSQTGNPMWPGDVYIRRYYFPVSLLVGTGRASTNPALLRTMRPDGTPGYAAFQPFAAQYGVNPGTAAIDGTGRSTLLAGPGPSPVYGPHVRGFNRDGTVLGKVRASLPMEPCATGSGRQVGRSTRMAGRRF